jgi:hypothetical protein
MQLVSTLCFLLIARIHARNVGDPTGLSLRGAESDNAGPTEGDQGEDERRGLAVFESCSDAPGWYDSDGITYNCEWYGLQESGGGFDDNKNPEFNWGIQPSHSKCSNFGDSYENQGYTANSACCVCGGGFNVVEQFYCRVLQRKGDPAGIAGWAAYLESESHTVKDMVREGILSKEFKDAFVNGKSGVTVARTLYDVVLARAGDPDGLAHWGKEVKSLEWNIVVDRLLASKEYNKRFGDDAVPGGGRAGCGLLKKLAFVDKKDLPWEKYMELGQAAWAASDCGGWLCGLVYGYAKLLT